MTSPLRTKPVTVVVVGDAGVGKTALITAAATEGFAERPPPTLPPTRLPADATPEGVPLVLTDTSSRGEDRAVTEAALRAADAVVVAFDVARQETLARVTSHWMPELARLGVTAPVVLVGCKADAAPADAARLTAVVAPVMHAHRQVETCLECSAKKLVFVGEVFYYALKAVIHPTAPLYDAAASNGAGALRPAAIRALKRVFAACDADGDGTLSDAELNAFQVRCFSAPLSPDELAGVKRVVADRLPSGVAPSGHLTLAGFLFLHALFIERGRLETTWAVLRTFGYGDDLTLSPAALAGAARPPSPDACAHLTPRAVAFFEAAFRRADRDGDGELSAGEEADLWSTAPAPPWPPARDAPPLAPRGRGGGLTLAGLVARLHALAAADPEAAAAAALYAGLDARAGDVVAASRPRRAERRDGGPAAAAARPLLRGLVLGSAVGAPARRALVAAVAGCAPPPPPPPAAAAAAPLSAVGPLPPPPADPAAGDAKPPPPPPPTQYMQLTDVPLDAVADLAADPAALAAADVAAFVFDAADAASFDAAHAALVEIADAAGPSLPCVLVAAADGRDADAAASAAVAAACGALDVRLPVPFSSLLPSDGASAVSALAAAARGGARATPATPALRARRARERALRRALLAAAAGAAAAGAAYAVWRAARGGGGKGEEAKK